MQDANQRDERIVEEVFTICEDELYDMASRNGYLKWAQDFWKNVKSQRMWQMSEKQLTHLRKIKRYLDEENCR